MTDHSFLISSDELDRVETRMIGMMITDDGKLWMDKMPPQRDGTGYYVLIEREEGRIRITQDPFGSFGLFLYREEDRFLLSNSFFLLAEKAANRLSLHREYLMTLICARECPVGHNATLAREIVRLSSDRYVEIDLASKCLSVFRTPRTLFGRKPETDGDFALLDKWYFKWVRFFRTLAEKQSPFFADLSGGLDTRIILSMLLNGDIDLNTAVRMTTHDSVNIPKDAEDMRIAGTIAKELSIRMNTDLIRTEKTGRISPEETYRTSRQFTMGQTNYCRLHSICYHEPVFFAKGLGSTVKGSVAEHGKAWSGMEEALAEWDAQADRLLNELPETEEREKIRKTVKAAIRRDAGVLMADVQGDDGHRASVFYQKVLMEGRDAKKVLDSSLRNTVIVSPFMDPMINQFDYNPYGDDPLYLATLILSRYRPELLRFEIEHRTFVPESVRRAEELNRKYPVLMPDFGRISGRVRTVRADSCKYEEITEYLERLYASEDFIRRIDRVIGSEMRRAVLAETPANLHQKRPYRPYALMALYEFLKSDGYHDV